VHLIKAHHPSPFSRFQVLSSDASKSHRLFFLPLSALDFYVTPTSLRQVLTSFTPLFKFGLEVCQCEHLKHWKRLWAAKSI